jgi:peptidoglycan/xylan/chitin deacetylase (PgdA/CDA1 family)
VRALRPLLRDLAAESLARLQITQPRRRLSGQLTIATFHRVLPEAQRRMYPLPGLVVTPEELDWFLAYFRKHFQCGSLAETLRSWPDRNGGPPLLAITFDDGQLDNHQHARAVLARHALHASFYIPVAAVEQQQPLWHDHIGFGVRELLGRIGRSELLQALEASAPAGSDQALVTHLIRAAKELRPDERKACIARLDAATGGHCVPAWAGLMSWAQINALAADGHEIGSHSMTHPLLPQCTDAEMEHEIAESRRVLCERVQAPIESLCYPNGDYDTRAVGAAQRAGYRAAVTTRWGTNPRLDTPFELLRCDMDASQVRSVLGTMSDARLSWRISGLHPGLS